MLYKIKKTLFCLILLFLFFSNNLEIATGYDESSHNNIVKAAVENSNLNECLKNYLNLNEGIEKIINGNEVKEWMAFGGEAEDYGYWPKNSPDNCRAFNHFHDPLVEAWDDAGLDNVFLKNLYFTSYLRYPISPIIWGLDLGTQDFFLNFTGDWSWGKAREKYYTYLTGKNFNDEIIATTLAEKNGHFADCFRALGQVMHLLQDMSVPLHTRNDPHIFPLFGMVEYETFWTYETYISKYIGNHIGLSPIFPPNILLSEPHPDQNYPDIIPVSGLFDRNQYDGTAPPSNNNLIGLSEYSNANFLTADTMWDDSNNYPYPSQEQTNYNDIDWWSLENLEQVDAEDDKTDTQHLYKKAFRRNPSRGSTLLDRRCNHNSRF